MGLPGSRWGSGDHLAGGPGSFREESRSMSDDRSSGAAPAGVQGEERERTNQKKTKICARY